MHEDLSRIDAGELEHSLAESELVAMPSEAHGMLCGFLAIGVAEPVTRWLKQLFPAGGSAADAPALLALASRTEREFAQTAGCLTLWLPPDEAPLAERARALHDWLRGFLFAWGVEGITPDQLPEQTREIYHDFIELTRMDIEQIDEDEEQEGAFVELVEFVRVAALLVRVPKPVTRADA